VWNREVRDVREDDQGKTFVVTTNATPDAMRRALEEYASAAGAETVIVPVSPASDRSSHPEGAPFQRFFNKLLLNTGSCWERDVLRDTKETLWAAWKAKHSKGET
jgi:hypothetical protein